MKKEDLQKRTKRELLALASEKGLRLSIRLRKAELVDQVLSFITRRKPSGPAPTNTKKKRRSPDRKGLTPVPRQRRPPSRPRAKPPAQEALPKEELHRISEEISRCFPPTFQRTEIVLLEVDPFHAHAYWHVRLEDLETSRRELGVQGTHAALMLRFYDVTLLDFDGSNAHSYFDVAIHTLQSNYYVDFWESGRSYLVEIGLRTHDGRYHALARSNHIELPSHAPSDNYDWAGVVVDPSIKIICEVADVTRAEVFADIRPEPRLGMEPDTSDDLVRSFYRQLTDQGFSGSARPKRAQRASERPEFRTSPERGGTRKNGLEEHPVSAGNPAESPRNSPAAGQREREPDSRPLRQRAGNLPPSASGRVPGTFAEGSPLMTARSRSVESSYGVYEARKAPVGVSSWTTAAGGISSWVSSPRGSAGSDPLLGQVFVLPQREWKESAAVSELSAELVIQGRAAPGSQFSLLGQPVRVRPDGTFYVRTRLPEGAMVVPLPQEKASGESPDSEGDAP